MPAIGPRIPAQSFGIDEHLTILPVAAPPQLIHSQANAALSEITDAMATRLFYQGKKLHSLISDETATSLLRTAAHAHAERRTNGVGAQSLLLATNEPGSVLQICATSGQTQPLNYTAYGTVPAALSALQTLMFNGEWRESLTDCYHLGSGYRLFNPALMRFHSPDSMSPFSAGGLNSYAYCLADPVNATDPSGHIKVTRPKTPPRPIARVAPSPRQPALATPVAAAPQAQANPVAGPSSGRGPRIAPPRDPAPNQTPNRVRINIPRVSEIGRLVIRDSVEMIDTVNGRPPSTESASLLSAIRDGMNSHIRAMSPQDMSEVDSALTMIRDNLRGLFERETTARNYRPDQ